MHIIMINYAKAVHVAPEHTNPGIAGAQHVPVASTVYPDGHTIATADGGILLFFA
jgi:hypothetical protein